jgi:hypothetical protein
MRGGRKNFLCTETKFVDLELGGRIGADETNALRLLMETLKSIFSDVM